METATQIKARISALSATVPQDEDPYAEARAEAAHEERIDYTKNPELITVGMGVTMRTGMGGLYRPYTVIEVQRGGKLLKIQADKVIQITRGVSYSDDGEKAFERDPQGRIETISLRKDGTFIGKGAPMEWYATRYYIGHRRDWTDYSQ